VIRYFAQEYYEFEVNYIFDSVVDSLLQNPMRKFIEVEMYGHDTQANQTHTQTHTHVSCGGKGALGTD
jgi:hypothetical protein